MDEIDKILAEAMEPTPFADPDDYFYYERHYAREQAMERAVETQFRLFKAGYVIVPRGGSQ